MGLTDIFGGGDQQSKSTTKVDPFNKWQAGQNMSWLYGNQGDRSYFGGDTYAGFDPLQNQGQDMQLNAADQMYGGNQNMWDAQQAYMDPSFLDPANNPRIQGMMDAATRGTYRNLDENLLPGARGSARVSGGQEYGSSRDTMREAILERGTEDRASDIRSQILTDTYGQHLGAQQNAMRMQPMVNNQMQMPGNIYNQVGGSRQMMNQMGITDDVNRYNYERDIGYNDRLQNLGLNFGSGGGQQTTTNTSGAGPGAGMLGAGMMAYGMMNPMMGAAQMGYNNYSPMGPMAPWST